MKRTKIIAMYLPQYHCIPENDRFWGKGFTDWTTVKKSKPLFKGHIQPRVPLNDNYYDLSIEENIVWQSQLAKEYGIDGFGVYHYWFNNDTNILTRPAEIIRDSPNVNIEYLLAWDNASWVRSWTNVQGNAWAPQFDGVQISGPKVLIPYVLGEKNDWKKHFESLLSHFRNSRYIKVENKPVFIIFNYTPEVGKMCDYWNDLAIQEGYSGMHIIIKRKYESNIPDRFYQFKYEPLFSGWPKISFCRRIEMKLRRMFYLPPRVHKHDYDKVWNNIIKNALCDDSKKIYSGAFVSYDDTPRRGGRGTLTKNGTPKKFGKYLSKLFSITNKQNKEFIFLTAWNEWGEGAYLEPDTINRFDFLKEINAIKNG